MDRLKAERSPVGSSDQYLETKHSEDELCNSESRARDVDSKIREPQEWKGHVSVEETIRWELCEGYGVRNDPDCGKTDAPSNRAEANSQVMSGTDAVWECCDDQGASYEHSDQTGKVVR